MAKADQVNNELRPDDKTSDFSIHAQKAIEYFIVLMIQIGSGITDLVFIIAKKLLVYIGRFLGLIKSRMEAPFKKLSKVFKKFIRKIPQYFSDSISSVREFISKTLSIGKKYGKGDAAKFVAITAGKKVWSCRKIVTTAFNWAAPVLSVTFLISIISYAKTLDYGIGVECNGEDLGIVAEEGAYDEAEKVLQQRITYVEGNETVTITPKLSVKVVKDTTEIINPNQLADKMIGNTDSELIKAWGIYIDGQFIGAVENRDAIENSLAAILKRYDTTDAKLVKFVKPVDYKNGLYLKSSMVDENKLIRLINSDTNVEVSYTVESGDSPSLIAQKNGITTRQLLELNPGLDSRCLVGDKVVLSRRQPYMAVEVVKELSYSDVLPYETVKIEDNSQYKNIETVITKGQDGQRDVKAEVTYVNGYETGRVIISQNITKQPVTQKVSVGTKIPTPSRGGYSSGNTIYQWPLAGGYISSHFGETSGRSKPHYALDIAAPNGTTIFAAESGTVVMARWYYGYGNCTQIRHSDGYITLYGHQSKILVTEGQKVSKGEPIGLVGNTGESYGNHLHFEVIKNGIKYDPEKFVC